MPVLLISRESLRPGPYATIYSHNLDLFQMIQGSPQSCEKEFGTVSDQILLKV